MEFLIEHMETTVKLIIALILGVLVGMERTVAQKTAGMRTYGLVSMGAALFVIISEIAVQKYLVLELTNFDPLRMASNVLIGIGFLGAGLIVLKKDEVSGLTTAAGLWVSAGIGTATGFGMYWIAIFATLLTLFVFSALWYIEQTIKKKIC